MRSVLFVDPPAFCTTLEGLVAPALRTRPLAVAPPGADQATILALSAEARSAGLLRGMSVRKAQRLCPDLVVLPPNPQLYARASRALHQILRAFAPTIEPRGYGHAFLDLTGTGRLFGPPQDVAARIRQEANEQLRIPLSVGIATNKLVSQAAIKAERWTAGQQGSNQSLLYVPSGNERSFLAPHPVEVLPELDPGIRARLEDYQLELIGEVAAISESALCAVFGREGRLLRARAQGIDPRPVLSPERQSEFHLVHTLATDTNDLGVLHPMLRMMTERLGHRLRRRRLTAARLRLMATYADYTVVARAVPLSSAILDAELWEAARRAFELANSKRLAVRAVALTLDRLMEIEAQLELWAGGTAVRRYGGTTVEHQAEAEEAGCLQHALDRIKSRYGAQAVVRGGGITSHQFKPVRKDPTAVPPYRLSSPDYHDLPKGRVALEDPMGVGQLSHGIGSLQHGAEHGALFGPRFEERQHPLAELPHQRDSFFQPSGAHDGTNELEPLPQNRTQVGVGSAAGQKSEHDQPSPRREHRQVIGQGGPAENIEHHMNRLSHRFAKGRPGGVEPHVQPIDQGPRELVAAARGAQDSRSKVFRNLGGSGPDAAARGVNQYPLARLQPRPGNQGIVGGQKCLGNCRRLRVRQSRRNRQDLVLMHHHHFGLGAPSHQTHDPVAHLPSGDTRPHRLDLTGILEARNVGRPPMGRRVVPATLNQVGPVQPSRVDPHPDVVLPYLRLGHLADGDDLGAPCPLIYHRAHDWLLAMGYGL
jgi:DNA polymerase IV